jgi:hypothetical protein
MDMTTAILTMQAQLEQSFQANVQLNNMKQQHETRMLPETFRSEANDDMSQRSNRSIKSMFDSTRAN